MIGSTVRLKNGDGALYRVRRDGINNFGSRELRLRALDGGPLLFVGPDEIEVVNPSLPTGQATASKAVEASTNDGPETDGEATGDD